MRAAVPTLAWMKATRSLSLSSSWTMDACEIPSEASSVTDLTMRGKGSHVGRLTRRPCGTTMKSGNGMRWNEKSFLARTLSRASINPRGLQPV